MASNILTHERIGRILAGLVVLAGLVLSLLSPWFMLAVAGTALNLVLSGITDRCAVKSLLIRIGFPGERDVGRAEGTRERLAVIECSESAGIGGTHPSRPVNRLGAWVN